MTDLFTQTNTNNPPTDTNKNYFEELVGEGKKFKSQEDLARAKVESDRFIEQLKGELGGIRQELNTRLTIEQMMDKISTPRSETPNSESGSHQPSGNGEGGAKQITEEDIARLVEQRLSQADKLRTQEANLNFVRSSLEEKYGPQFATHLKEAASTLGVGEEFLNNLAKEQPKAFLKLIENETPKQPTASNTNGLFTPPQGRQMAPVKGFTPTGDRKMSYYNDLKAKDPSTYWSPSVQNQLHQDALRLGETFFDT